MDNNSQSRSRLVLVQNRAGVSIPFQLEELANSLLVTGLEPPDTYAIASRLEASLRDEQVQEIDSAAIEQRVAQLLSILIDDTAAERYRAWRRFRYLGRPLVVCLLGAPGVGKSTTAARLALRLGIPRVMSTESVREVLRTVVPASVLPELHRSVLEVGAGFVRQTEAVGQAAAAAAAGACAEGRSVLLVGSHLVPGETRARLAERGSDAMVLELLLTLEDEALHRSRMLRRLRSDPAMPGVRHLQNFRAVRSLQQRLVELAQHNDVVQHDLAGEARLTEWVVDRVIASCEVSTAR
ncbi:MAG: AAA family ATPase [Planctomycetota bacterium]